MPSIFVSRDLAVDSPIRHWALDNDYEVTSRSLIQFREMDFTVPPTQEGWVFFYSPKAVEYWCRGCAKEPAFEPGVKYGVLGPGTARALLEYELRVDFCGQGDPRRVALDFLSVAIGQRVIFPRAVQSRRTVEQLIEAYIEPVSVVVYGNEVAPQTDLVPTDIVVLTSPLNVKAYFRSTQINPDARFVAIGATTATALRQYGIIAVYPSVPGEAGIAQLLGKLA